MRKKFLAIVLVLAASLSLSIAAQAAPAFSDVPASHWAYAEIEKCCNQGIVNGYSDGTFKPTATVTGAHFTVMLTRMFYPEELAANAGRSSEGWYMPALTAANSKGLLAGTSRLASGSSDNWKSCVNLPLSRYDMAQMLNNILKEKGITVSSSDQVKARSAIKDWSGISSQYQEAVQNCYALGVINGTSNGTFSGGNSMNRAQACAVINRVVNKSGSAPSGGDTGTGTESSASLKMDSSAVTLAAGASGKVKATLTGGSGTISYASSNESVATVDASGNVSAKQAGTATITASATVNGKKLTAACTVTVTASQASTPEGMSAEIVELVNQERAKAGLSPLGTLPTLTAAAQIRAPELETLFEHTRPDGRKCFTALDEAKVTNYYTGGENIAYGANSAESVMTMWMNSPGHKANILGKNFTHIGVAVHKASNGRLYFVQMFIGSNAQSTPTTPTQTGAISITPTTLSLQEGESGSVKATLTGGTGRISYSSSNSSIATVDGSGNVTGRGAGKATITATATVSGKTLTATCAVTVTAAAAPPAETAKSLEDISAGIIELVNQERAKVGASPLGTIPALTAAAEIRAPEIGRSFSHDRPDGRECFTALDEAGMRSYYTAGENIAAGGNSAESFMNMWMNSPGHKANILNKNFTHIGVAGYKASNGGYYFVQMFVGSNVTSSGSGSGSGSGTGTGSGSQGGSGSGSWGGSGSGSGTGTGTGSGSQGGSGSGSQGSSGSGSSNPGRLTASAVPSDGFTHTYREDWADGSYLELSASGSTVTFKGCVERDQRLYNYSLLSVYGYNNEDFKPFVSGEPFTLSVDVDMDSFREFYAEKGPVSHISSLICQNYTPNASSYAGSGFQNRVTICLALDENNDLTLYVKK